MEEKEISLSYRVAMPQPESHLFEVELRVSNWRENQLNLKMPVWTPGSYLIREYSRNVQNFQAYGRSKKPLQWRKLRKNHWLVFTEDCDDIMIKYQVYSNELTVRTNHLDSTHGFFNGAALFFYIPNYEAHPITVTIFSPDNWRISTPLPATKNKNTFLAENFDTLVDSPFEIGVQEVYDFTVDDKPHQWVVWGRGNIDIDRVIYDTKRIIKTTAEIFGSLPYSEYKFILHLSGEGFGGLEHKNCCVLNYHRFGFRKPEKYYQFMQLVAHEFFHLWNVKRIRPKELEKFDYDQENYTTSLWFCEGATSYYDLLIPLRAGIYGVSRFLELLSKEISQYFNTPGRKIQSLSESSFDAWIKLYRQDAYSKNNQISYYLKGELVTMLLDLLIRNNSDNRKSFDDVMRIMWQRFGREEIGFTPEELQGVIEEVANQDLSEFLHLCLETTTELPFNKYFEPFGLILEPKAEENNTPYLGINVQREGNVDRITFVDANSPAGKGGICAGDELLAIDGFRVTAETLSDRLQDYQVGDWIELTVFQKDILKTVKVCLASPLGSYQVRIRKRLSQRQKENLRQWLGFVP
ncbi:MAG: M61 family metallopeptidase [Geminocystis sp.]|nr:M61 family metallopeptidase [Geminocystis sp.]MCS7148007.1 M61 family metallopeptidase [Geminocystis sp.]MCX8078982.1 M61 family metallopeptidase [Geminocystis sp.]MDW8116913.1 M61 family metallopeptidase [Geminocystis sp.]MDW8462550.1 M61 family metallopeptidase [Geminocystis sp.]